MACQSVFKCVFDSLLQFVCSDCIIDVCGFEAPPSFKGIFSVSVQSVEVRPE